MEVTNCTATDLDLEAAPSEANSLAPKGLSSITDSLEPHHVSPRTPKPTLLTRISISIGLIIVYIITMSIQFLNWLLNLVFRFSNRQKVLYRELHHISKNGVMSQVQEFLVNNSHHTFAAGYLFSEFLDLPEIHLHLTEILKGANICFENDKGFFCRRWSEHPDCYRRTSSHNYQGEECYAIGHLLFWLDLDGNTRFQFENSPLKGFFSSIRHFIDYLWYRRDNKQQGVTGTSEYTEEYCLKIEVDALKFMVRKLK